MAPSFFKRLFSSALRRATAAEQRGDITSACALYVDAGEPEDACRLWLERADDLGRWERVESLRETLEIAPKGSESERRCQRALADAIVDWVDHAGVDDRRDRTLLEEAAELLMTLEDHDEAGDLFRRIGHLNRAGEAYTLAGSVEKLDAAYDAADQRVNSRARRRARVEDAELAAAQGQFAEALALLDEAVVHAPEDIGLRERRDALARRIPERPILALEDDATGAKTILIAGASLVIGRDPQSAQIALRLPGVSRAHVRLTRVGGRVTIQDLGAKNGSSLDGVPCSETPTPLDGESGEIALGTQCTLRYTRVDAALRLEVIDAPLAAIHAWGERGRVDALLPNIPLPEDVEVELREGFWYLRGAQALRFDGEVLAPVVMLRLETLIETPQGHAIHVRAG